MTLKEQWKRETEVFNKSLTIKQLALIISPKPEDWKKYYQKIYRDLEMGRIDYTQMGEERNPILISIDDAKAYIDTFKSSNIEMELKDLMPSSKTLPFPPC